MNMFAKNIIIVLISYAYQPGTLYTVHQAAFDDRHYKLCSDYIYIHIHMHTYLHAYIQSMHERWKNLGNGRFREMLVHDNNIIPLP